MHSLTDTYTRRHWLHAAACGFGGVALQGMIAELARASQRERDVSIPRHAARARRIIFLFMSGGPSQLDLFDPKPFIQSKHGESVAFPIDGNEVSVGVDKYLALAPFAPLRPRGQSGMVISDMLPHLAAMADEICLLRAVQADNEAHAPAISQLHTGAALDVRPSLGSWVSYGLGTENRDLPSFISIHPHSDIRTYGSSFLPAVHQGTPVTAAVGPNASAIRHLHDSETDSAQQRRRLRFMQGMNRRLLDRFPADPQMEGMIASFELAFRMQAEAPRLVELSGETQETQQLYGIGEGATDRNGRACLLARRLSEAGVRFVQVTMDGWDHHDNIRDALPKSCAATDKPVAGLVLDLKRRGLLDDTLVLWSGEFGRTPWSQDLSGTSPIDRHGREHQPDSFCAWLAGGGVRRGFTYGESDEFGFRPVSGKVHLHDLHATLLHLLGIDHEQLTYRHAGRDYRLTDVHGEVVRQIIA